MDPDFPSCRRILVPTDFSEASQAALRLATALARDQGAELLIAHVAPPRDRSGGVTWDEDTLALNRLLDEIRPPDPRVAVRRRLVRGDNPAETLLKLVRSEAVDLIVMATRGRGEVSQLLLGSVATTLMRRANCSVLTLRAE